jgi:serine/threonine-protein kinase
MADTPNRPTSDRNLLFGILALQMDFIGRDQLIAAMHAWVLDKATPLGDLLQGQGALAEDERAILDALVEKHLRKHGGDPERSLAAVVSGGVAGSVHAELQGLADPDLDASLAHIGAAATPSAPDHADGGNTVDHAGEDDPPLSCPVRFRVLRPHARGGLGEVFVAEDRELRREVAFKEIQRSFAHDPHSRSRFLLEAELTGALEHPGIVPVYGLGAYRDGRLFYAMRFIRGESLKDAIARFHAADAAGRDVGERTLALRQLLGQFVAVCQAVAYAHARGVIHRDLKPANVMLGAFGETLVVDWGLAKVVGRPEGDTTGEEATLRPSSGDGVATVAGTAVGTPAYMSPEQAAGRLDLVGPASDIYSLGATLYHLLTGQAPFGGEDPGSCCGASEGESTRRRARRRRVSRLPWTRSVARRWPWSPGTATRRYRNWQPTRSAGWPTSRSQLTASRCSGGWGGGGGGTRRWRPGWRCCCWRP